MTRYETPSPITLDSELGIGDLTVEATDRPDTVVEVRPANPDKKEDVEAARQTKVDLTGDRLVIRSPKSLRKWGPFGGRESVTVHVALPASSWIDGHAGVGSFRSRGTLGPTRYRAGVGNFDLEEVGDTDLKIGAGEMVVGTIAGQATLKNAGRIQVGKIAGAAHIRNSNGETWLGELDDYATIAAANGSIQVASSRSNVEARSSNGSIRLEDVSGGSISLKTAHGNLEVGVRKGVPAWLDVATKFGNVSCDLDESPAPGSDADSVEIRARSAMGDIRVHAAEPAGA